MGGVSRDSYLNRSVTIAAAIMMTVAAGGCGDPGGGGGVVPTTKGDGALPIARQIAAANAGTDRAMNLLARKFLANDTEMIEVYEPTPGVIQVSGAGRPAGAAAVTLQMLQAVSVQDLWSKIAPGEAMPASFDLAASALGAVPSPRTPPNSGSGVEEVTSALNGAYCQGQFLSDFSTFTTSQWNVTDGRFSNFGITSKGSINEAGYAVCADTGGTFSLSQDGGHNSGSWVLPNDTYRWNKSWSGWNCGFDFNCPLSTLRSCSPSQSAWDSVGTLTPTNPGDSFSWKSYYDVYHSCCTSDSRCWVMTAS